MTVREQLKETPDLLADGRLSEEILLTILIRVEFNAISGILYETALEALYHQYIGYGCLGACSSLEQELKWLNSMQGWYGRNGNSIPLDDCNRCRPDAVRVMNGVEVSDGYYAWWWANPALGSPMRNYIDSDPAGRSRPPWEDQWEERNPDRPLNGGFIIQGTIPGDGNYDRFVVVTWDQNIACGYVKCMGLN